MRVLLAIVAAAALSVSGLSAADELDDLSLRPTHADYALGVRKYRLEDGAARIVGWQLADHWYFGKRRGDDDGFGFVWQGDKTQIAITDEGLNWRRRVSFLQ